MLFCSSALLKEHDVIPLNEVMVYIFALVGEPSASRRMWLRFLQPAAILPSKAV